MFPHKLDINGKLKVTIKTVYDDNKFIKKTCWRCIYDVGKNGKYLYN